MTCSARRSLGQTCRIVKDTATPPPEASGCTDFIGMIHHGFAITHIDALRPFFPTRRTSTRPRRRSASPCARRTSCSCATAQAG